MALPVVNSLVECADFSNTVLPYVPQLYDLPQQILQAISSPQGLIALYTSINPLISAFAFSLFLALIFLIVSEINKNYSQIDRCWSLLPTVYNAHFAIYAHLVGLPTQRLDVLFAVSAIWSSRLTFNYWRKGGYSKGSEDYRWEVLKDDLGPYLFFVFNVFFISLAQSYLLFTVALPTYAILLTTRVSGGLSAMDVVYSLTILSLVTIAAIADQQQWDYHSAKNEYKKTGVVTSGYHKQDLERGFNTTGLWQYSRHPNFAAEQSVWVSFYLWSCQATDTFFNWTGVGALGYLILFQGSTWFTELISGRKYPDYAEYQKRVGKFVPPGFGSQLPGNFSDKRVASTTTKKTK